MLYVLAAAAVAVVAGIAAVVVTMVTSGTSNPTGFVPTGSSPGQDAQEITSAFLSAWQGGNLNQAARYTDRPAAAEAALGAYQKYLHLRKLTARAGTVTAASGARQTVQYSAKATVATSDSANARSGTWSYQSSLTAYQARKSQTWYIAWAPDVLAPNLTSSTHLAAVTAPPQVAGVEDASGNDLASYKDPGLTHIASLMEATPPPGKGAPGLYVDIQNAKDQAVPNSQAVVIPPENVPSLTTTITPAAENAARAAVARHAGSSMVAIQPSTGDILAIANNAGYNDYALTAAVAPGSTMKVITSTALITEGVVTANTGVSCPLTNTVQGITYHNDAGETESASTPWYIDFAVSCNNAFDKWWPDLTNGRLAQAAKKYYGLDRSWDIGIAGLSASYFNAPPSASGAELAQEAFGQGQLTASPIAMASVAATVDNGSFRQPILLPGTKRVTATPLPSSTDAQLKEMMRAVVTSGTAAGVGLGPGVYAKTGTADIKGQEEPNSWFIAFDPSRDIAVACLVVNAGYGASVAAPEVATFLNKF